MTSTITQDPKTDNPAADDGAVLPRLDRWRGTLTRVTRTLPTGGGVPRHPSTRTRKSRLPQPKRRHLAPRDSRWWAGAALMSLSMLLVAFVLHATLFSAVQHHREQSIAYDVLRVSLAKAETPVGQLDFDENLVAAGTPVALLDIPAIGLSEVVLEGTDAHTLRGGAGHRRDSVMPGQVGTSVVMGRQATYGGPFGDLSRLVPGDEISMTTGQGSSTYRVVELRRAGDPMPEDLHAGQGRLELATADGLALFPDGVLHVDAELVTDTFETPAKVMTYPALPVSERAMGHDAGAWFTTFVALASFAAAGVGVWWLWTRWGRPHAWVIGVPLLLALGVAAADAAMDALPNLL